MSNPFKALLTRGAKRNKWMIVADWVLAAIAVVTAWFEGGIFWWTIAVLAVVLAAFNPLERLRQHFSFIKPTDKKLRKK